MEGKFSGIDKAAIFLMNIGEELASEVMKYLNPSEVQLLTGTIVKKESIPFEVRKEIAEEFMKDAEKGDMVVEGIDFAKKVITKALGPEKANPILEQISRDMNGGGIESLKWMDPAMVANLIKEEHPQIIALVLTQIGPEKASQILLFLPERLRGEVMLRVATIGRVPHDAIRQLEEVIKRQTSTAGGIQGNVVEGVKIAAEILNQVDSKAESAIMEVIEKESPDLAGKIQDKMFVFADLLEVDDRGIQLLLKELDTETLSIALKGADDSMKDKFFKNMSERAAEMLKDDIEARGPVRLSDVEKAQQSIIRVARRLEQEGKLVRAGKGGDVVV